MPVMVQKLMPKPRAVAKQEQSPEMVLLLEIRSSIAEFNGRLEVVEAKLNGLVSVAGRIDAEHERFQDAVRRIGDFAQSLEFKLERALARGAVGA